VLLLRSAGGAGIDISHGRTTASVVRGEGTT
jgi:hypothetical protein